MKESLSKDVLFDFFDGRTTSIQRKLVEDWLADPQNEELYYHYLDEWESRHPQFSPKVEAALSAYISLINNEQVEKNAVTPNVETNRFNIVKTAWLWSSVAACLLL